LAKSTDPSDAIKKKFFIGAKVKLNAGGPVMAVKEHAANENWSLGGLEIVCQWFSGKKLETGRFAPETLILVKDDAEPEKQSS
jgi:uncharacterized protein YodC (DUF2158 family)